NGVGQRHAGPQHQGGLRPIRCRYSVTPVKRNRGGPTSFLLRCVRSLLALSRLSEVSAYVSAFGAKRTCTGVWLRSPRSLVTHSGHEWPLFAAMHGAII